MRPKDIGTKAETAVVRYLVGHGWPLTERRALHGAVDLGDITGTPGIVWEVKGGEAAKDPSDLQVEAWLAETEKERQAARAALGILVCQRRGKADAGMWWAWIRADRLVLGGEDLPSRPTPSVRVRLDGLVSLLRWRGWGDPS